MRRMALGIFVLLALSTGLFVLAPSGAGAEGPVSRFVGFVVVTPESGVPTKVRAVGQEGVVCGTADVSMTNELLGFYELTVISSLDRPGCPGVGEEIHFRLLYGSVDDGVVGHPNLPTGFVPGEIQVRHLSVSSIPASGGWSGTPPPSGGYALMVWGGPDGAPASQALSLLPIEVEVLYHYDATLRQFLAYVPGAPSFVQTYTVLRSGDIVVVKAR